MSEESRTALRQPPGTPEEVQGSGRIRLMSASDGYPIHFRHWPVADPLGVVVAAHGIQSHSGWYEYSSWRLSQAGFEVYFADRRGSGLNAVDRGHADHGWRLINDTRQLIQLARREHPLQQGSDFSSHASGAPHSKSASCIPVTMLGISWGGKIAAATAALFPAEIDQLALLYPGLEPRLVPTWIQRLQLRAARQLDVRRKSVPIPLKDPALFTDSPFWRAAIASDPLSLHIVTSGFVNSGRDLDNFVQQHAEQIGHRLLLMQAGRDAIIDNTRTRTRVATFGSTRTETLTYPHASHTLEFEDCRDEVIDDLIEWLRRGCDAVVTRESHLRNIGSDLSPRLSR